MTDMKVGDTVPQGTVLLFTCGEYSDFGVQGLYRAKKEFVIPGRPNRWHPRDIEMDVERMTTDPLLLEEVPYRELWTGR